MNGLMLHVDNCSMLSWILAIISECGWCCCLVAIMQGTTHLVALALCDFGSWWKNNHNGVFTDREINAYWVLFEK